MTPLIILIINVQNVLMLFLLSWTDWQNQEKKMWCAPGCSFVTHVCKHGEVLHASTGRKLTQGRSQGEGALPKGCSPRYTLPIPL
jgi:hypothetical protein